MKRKRIYVSPTVKVVETRTNVALLANSTSATLEGYEYQDGGWSD